MAANVTTPFSPSQFQGWASFYGGNVQAPQPPPPSAFGAGQLGQPPSSGQYTGGWAYPDAWANFYEGRQGFQSPQNQNSPAGALAVTNYARNINNPNDPNLLGWEQAYGNPNTVLAADQNWAKSLGSAPTGTPSNQLSGGWQNPEAWAAFYGGTHGFTAPDNAGSPASALAAASQIAKTSNPQDNPALLGWVVDYGQPGSVLANTPNWAASLGAPNINKQGQDIDQTNTQGWDSPLAWAAFYGGFQGFNKGAPQFNTLQAAKNWVGVQDVNDPSLLGWELDYGNPQTVISALQAQGFQPPPPQQPTGPTPEQIAAAQQQYQQQLSAYNAQQQQIATTNATIASLTQQEADLQAHITQLQRTDPTGANYYINQLQGIQAQLGQTQTQLNALSGSALTQPAPLGSPQTAPGFLPTAPLPPPLPAPTSYPIKYSQLPNGVSVVTQRQGNNVIEHRSDGSTWVNGQETVFPVKGYVAKQLFNQPGSGTNVPSFGTNNVQGAGGQAGAFGLSMLAPPAGAAVGGDPFNALYGYTNTTFAQAFTAGATTGGMVPPGGPIMPLFGGKGGEGGFGGGLPADTTVAPNFIIDEKGVSQPNPNAGAVLFHGWQIQPSFQGQVFGTGAFPGDMPAQSGADTTTGVTADQFNTAIREEEQAILMGTQQGLVPEWGAPGGGTFAPFEQMPPSEMFPSVDDYGRPIPDVGPPQPFSLPDFGGMESTVQQAFGNLGMGWTPPAPVEQPGSFFDNFVSGLPNILTPYNPSETWNISSEPQEGDLSGITPGVTLEEMIQSGQPAASVPMMPGPDGGMTPIPQTPLFEPFDPTQTGQFINPAPLTGAAFVPDVFTSQAIPWDISGEASSEPPPPVYSEDERLHKAGALLDRTKGMTLEQLGKEFGLPALDPRAPQSVKDYKIDFNNLSQAAADIWQMLPFGASAVTSEADIAQKLADTYSKILDQTGTDAGAVSTASGAAPWNVSGLPTYAPPEPVSGPSPTPAFPNVAGFTGQSLFEIPSASQAASPAEAVTSAAFEEQGTGGGPVGTALSRGVPKNVLDNAAAYVAGGRNTAELQQMMASAGYPQNSNWCADFASVIQKGLGNAVPPIAPALASNWQTWGVPGDETNPQPGDIISRMNVNPGGGGGPEFGHIMTIQSYDPRTDMVTAVQGNPAGVVTMPREQMLDNYELRSPGPPAPSFVDYPVQQADYTPTPTAPPQAPQAQAGYSYPSGTFSEPGSLQAGYNYPSGTFASGVNGMQAGYSYIPGAFGEIDPYNFSSAPYPLGGYGGGGPVEGSDIAQQLGLGDVPDVGPWATEGELLSSTRFTEPVQPNEFPGTDWSKFTPAPSQNIEDVRSPLDNDNEPTFSRDVTFTPVLDKYRDWQDWTQQPVEKDWGPIAAEPTFASMYNPLAQQLGLYGDWSNPPLDAQVTGVPGKQSENLFRGVGSIGAHADWDKFAAEQGLPPESTFAQLSQAPVASLMDRITSALGNLATPWESPVEAWNVSGLPQQMPGMQSDLGHQMGTVLGDMESGLAPAGEQGHMGAEPQPGELSYTQGLTSGVSPGVSVDQVAQAFDRAAAQAGYGYGQYDPNTQGGPYQQIPIETAARDENIPAPQLVADRQAGIPDAQGGGSLRGQTSIADIQSEPASQVAISRFATAFPNVPDALQQIYDLVAGESSFNGNAVTGQYRGFFQMSTAEAGRDPVGLSFAEQMDLYTNLMRRRDPDGVITNLGLYNAASALHWQTDPVDTVVYAAQGGGQLATRAAQRGAHGNGDTWGLYSPNGVRNPYQAGEPGRDITIAGIEGYYARNRPQTDAAIAGRGAPQPFQINGPQPLPPEVNRPPANVGR